MNIREQLRAADPLSHEPSVIDGQRDRVLAAVLAPHTRAQATSRARSRLRWTSVGIATALLVAAVAYQVRSASTRVLAAVRFEVRLAEEQPVPGLTVAKVATSGRLVYLYPTAVVDNADIAQAWVVDEGSGGRFGVTIQLLPDGATKMRQATTGHLGKPVALMLDGDVVVAPTLRSVVSDTASITGDYTRAEAERIAAGVVP